LNPQFNIGHNFSEGLASIQIINKWGYIDKTGKIVIEPQFEEAYPFEGGAATVYLGRCEINERTPKSQKPCKLGYIDRTGKYIWKPSN
jgi:hypothetical protein